MKSTGIKSEEAAIREVVDSWLSASKNGDISTLLSLMTDDVIFMVPGRKPFGKREFVLALEGMKDIQLEVTSDIQEIQVMGKWAYLRNHIWMTATLPGESASVYRSGYTLTIMHKEPDGRWRLARDANLLVNESPRPDPPQPEPPQPTRRSHKVE
jgi:uncharacterized protein (TIGR02246 family)